MAAPLSSKVKLLWVRAAQRDSAVVNEVSVRLHSSLWVHWATWLDKFKTPTFRQTYLIFNSTENLPIWLFIHNFLCTVCGDGMLLQSLRLSVNISYLEPIACHLLKIRLIVLALAWSQESILSTTGCSQLVDMSVKANSIKIDDAESKAFNKIQET